MSVEYFVLARSEHAAREWIRDKFGYDAQYMKFVYIGSSRSCEGLRVRSWQVLRAPDYHTHPENFEIEGSLRRSILRTETPGDQAIDRYLKFDDPIAQHHRPDMESMRYCTGCDMGCSCERAEWPCSTAHLIAEREGFELPDDVRWF